MTAAGWAFLLLSWGLIAGLCVFCFRRILHHHYRRPAPRR